MNLANLANLESTDRLKRFVYSNLGLVFYFLSCLYASFIANPEALPWVMLVFSLTWLGHGAFSALSYRPGLEQKTVKILFNFHLLYCCISLCIMIFLLPEMRMVTAAAMILILGLAPLIISPKGVFKLVALVAASFIVGMWQDFYRHPDTEYWLNASIPALGLLLAMGGILILGQEYARLRKKMLHKNQELDIALHKIKALALTDELTGLYNRRYMMNMLHRQAALANRGQYNFVVCFVDIDHFKQLNDKYGHQTGDRVLKAFAEVAQQTLRENDFAARFGGEEFVLLLTDIDLGRAQKVGERIRRNFSEISFEDFDDDFAVSLSMGITSYQSTEPVEQMIARADKLMYLAKKHGRNRVVAELHQDNLANEVVS